MAESGVSVTDEKSDLTRSNASRQFRVDTIIDAVFINYFNSTLVYQKVSTLLDLVSLMTLKWRDDSIEVEFEKEVHLSEHHSTKLTDFQFRGQILNCAGFSLS